jgi:Zn-finger nucleic acid-binding protein
MNCPKCNSSFDSATDNEMPVYHCPTCSGTWIHGQSLHRLLAASEDADSITETLDSIHHLDFRASRRKCPSCRGRHLKAVVVENTELDFCANCKGLFFDPGELERVFPGILGQGKAATNARNFWHSLLGFINRA